MNAPVIGWSGHVIKTVELSAFEEVSWKDKIKYIIYRKTNKVKLSGSIVPA